MKRVYSVEKQRRINNIRNSDHVLNEFNITLENIMLV